MVLGLIPAPRAKLWVGSLSHGLAQFDPQRQRFEDHSYPDQGFAINTLLDDGAGTLWAGSTKGIFYWHTSSDPLQTPPLSLPESAGWDVHDLQLSQGTQAWVASQTGLFRLDVQTGALEPILEGVNARVVLETDSALWVGTSGQGLLKVDPTDGRFQDFTLEAGLPGNTIQGLIRDRQGRLWITTTQGLAWLDLRTERIRSFSPAEAPPIYEFYPKSALAQPDGTLLLGGNGGILHLDPSQIMDAPHPPRPVISRLQVFDQAYPALPGAVDGAFRLRDSTQTFPHDQNDLTFEYAGLHFLRPEENTYRYQLVPYETDWREVGNRRTAIYPNLPPGTYTFRVQAANPDGRWSLATASLRVVIRLPWWKTPAAWVAYGLLVLGTFFAANRLQRHRLIRAERARAHLRETQLRAEVAEAHSLQLQELDEAKARLYANITHEFRTPLTVIMGMTDRIRGHVQERNLIHRNSQNLLRLMNQLLDLSKLEAGILTLNLVQGNIIQYLQYLTESFYSLAQQQGIRLLFYPELEELMMDFDEEKIQHVIYNLLSNALKFTPEQGKVVLHATRLDTGEESWLQLKVQDSGIGIAADDLPRIFERFYQADASSTRKEEGAGIGLSLTQDLVNMMAGEISVVSTLGKGTTFTLRLPIQRHAPLLVAGTPTMAQPLPTSAGASADAPAPPLPTPGDSTEKPILVLIEDNADVATYILELQGKTGQKERCHAALGRGCG
jgi:signal transduction histidine kinase/streptogramin lyase